jgi:transcriptional regulator
MHPNPAFHHDDPAFHEWLIAAIGFGMVFLQTPSGPRVAHTALVSTREGAVRFHLSNGNALTPHLDGTNALVLVNGPHAYVSPRWYEDRGQAPTWNYVALELEGPVRRLADEELADLLGTIGAFSEGRLAGEDRWRPEHMPAERWNQLFSQITGFELTIEHRRATCKLSQNKGAEDRARVADALENEGSPALAAMMRGLAP